jgi:hypothetical protein
MQDLGYELPRIPIPRRWVTRVGRLLGDRQVDELDHVPGHEPIMPAEAFLLVLAVEAEHDPPLIRALQHCLDLKLMVLPDALGHEPKPNELAVPTVESFVGHYTTSRTYNVASSEHPKSPGRCALLCGAVHHHVHYPSSMK